MLMALTTATAGGHSRARRLVCVLAALLAATFLCAPMAADSGHQATVREVEGVYHVAASFDVPHPHSLAYGVLTDYEQVPRFMPDVRTSVVRERSPLRILLEQEAVAKFMFFSKRVHLLLEVRETPGAIRFRDTSYKSFERYEGGWTFTSHEDRTTIEYALTAKPSFSVPGFVLSRLLKRDAGRMIAGLRAEMAKRAAK